MLTGPVLELPTFARCSPVPQRHRRADLQPSPEPRSFPREGQLPRSAPLVRHGRSGCQKPATEGCLTPHPTPATSWTRPRTPRPPMAAVLPHSSGCLRRTKSSAASTKLPTCILARPQTSDVHGTLGHLSCPRWQKPFCFERHCRFRNVAPTNFNLWHGESAGHGYSLQARAGHGPIERLTDTDGDSQ